MTRLLAIVLLLALPGTAGAATLVDYSRSGGIAGESTSLTVKRDRHAKLVDRDGERRFRLARKRYRALRADLRAARFATLEPEYGSTMIADGIDVSVTFDGHTVVVHSDGDPPKRLTRVLERLYRLSQ